MAGLIGLLMAILKTVVYSRNSKALSMEESYEIKVVGYFLYQLLKQLMIFEFLVTIIFDIFVYDILPYTIGYFYPTQNAWNSQFFDIQKLIFLICLSIGFIERIIQIYNA